MKTKEKTFTVTDKYDRKFIFVGTEEQIRGLQELCMAESFRAHLIKIEDELGIFAIPVMQGTFTPNEDGDYVFTDGKWNGMVFHPYSKEEVYEIIPAGTMCEITDNHGELTVLLRK